MDLLASTVVTLVELRVALNVNALVSNHGINSKKWSQKKLVSYMMVLS